MLESLFVLIFNLGKWKANMDVPKEARQNCVVVAAPHTSNWDFVYMIAALKKIGVKVRFTIKSNWKKVPILNRIMRSWGAIWIDRGKKDGKKIGMVDQMAAMFEDKEDLVIIVSAEGTRSKVSNWKTGYYHIAHKVGIPIVLGYVDYRTKECGLGKVVWTTGDMEKDMQEVMDFYQHIAPKFPENFSLDQRYLPQKG